MKTLNPIAYSNLGVFMSMSKVKALVDGAETLLKVVIEEFEAAVAKMTWFVFAT